MVSTLTLVRGIVACTGKTLDKLMPHYPFHIILLIKITLQFEKTKQVTKDWEYSQKEIQDPQHLCPQQKGQWDNQQP